MKNNTLEIKTNPENIVKLPLDEILRQGAQKLLTQAVEVEVNLFVERYQYIMDEESRRLVVKNGHHDARTEQVFNITTSASSSDLTNE